MNNLFQNIPLSIPNELTEVLLNSEKLRVERIVSTGHKSHDDFWYDQDEHELVFLLKGESRLQFEESESIQMMPGDFLNIPAHKKHRVEWTTGEEPTVWLAVFYKD